ncbi:MAG: TlpA family protein disulfide reductase [Muribaculaceae bacterium]|nr:TlpA family protein disulfide reductase [Muribaculaceae bacterium]
MKTTIYLIIAFILNLALVSCISEEEPDAVSLSVGDKCPDFSVRLNDGKLTSTSDLKGMTSVIVFFNTSCPDCRREFPQIQKVYDFAVSVNRPITVLCIARAESDSSIKSYWELNGLSMPYSAQEDKSVYDLFASSVIPRIYIISPSLEITATWSDNPLPTAEEIINKL